MALGLILGIGRAFRRERTSSLDILTSKRSPRGFYKGNNCKPTGFHTRKVRDEMEGTVFAPALEGMKHVKSEDGVMLTKPFLDVCKLILPVIDKFGAAMTLVKSDIGGNINRLETKYLSNPTKYNHLYSMVLQEEVDAKTAKGSSSCTNGLL